jgi:hypothetical protein
MSSVCEPFLLSTIARDRWVWAGLLCVAFVCIPLFVISPGSDWTNHVWMVDYFARFFSAHGRFPSELNTDQLVGMPFPVFYGYLFFPAVSVFSTVMSGNLTLRIFAALLLACQFILIYQTAWQWTKHRLFAFSLGTIMTWSIYPLTNLYNRGAIPEFFACGLLTCACVALLQALNAANGRRFFLWCNFSVLCLTACAGTHPITALYGLIFYVVLAVVGLIVVWRKRPAKLLLAVLVPAAIGSMCLAPWVVATARYNRVLDIAKSFREVSYYPKSIDGIHLRLCPVPVPIYNLRHKAKDESMGTPGLDAEINIPLLLLFISILISLVREKRLRPAVSFVLFVLISLAVGITYVSSVQHALDKLGYCARAIQFAYRLVTYINLAIFSATMIAISPSQTPAGSVPATAAAKPEPRLGHDAAADRSDNYRPGTVPFFGGRRLLALLLLTGFVGMSIKLHHTQKLDNINKWPMFAGQISDRQLLQLSFGFYGHQNYSMPELFKIKPEVKQSQAALITLLPSDGRQFGIVDSVTYRPKGRLWAITNVQPFLWNDLSINDHKLSQEQGLAFRTVTTLAARPLDDAKSICIKNLEPGTLKFSFRPDLDWAVLNAVSFPLFFLWLGATAVFSLRSGLTRAPAPSAISPEPAAVATN